MDAKTFKKGVSTAFVAGGFEAVESGLQFRGGAGVDVVVSIDKSARLPQVAISVGFWIRHLNGEVPPRAEKTHAYFPLESLFAPDHYEAIMTACALHEPGQEHAYARFIELLNLVLVPRIKSMASVTALEAELSGGNLSCRGLLTARARECLEKHRS